MLLIQKHPEGITFKIFVQPRSARNMIVGLHDDALKIKLTAPPVDQAANKMCVKFLAKSLGVSKPQVEILSGHTSRTKQILLRSSKPEINASEHQNLEIAVLNLIR